MIWSFFLFVCLVASTSAADASEQENKSAGITLIPITDEGQIRIFDYKFTNTLKCNVSAPLKPDLAIQWAKNDIMIDGNDAKYDIKSDSLVVHKTVEDDIAKYFCIIVNKTDNRHITRAEIKVIGKPTAKITQKIPQGAFIEGQKITLECVAQGNPIPEMEWRFENTTYSPSSETVDTTDATKKSENRVKVTKTTPYTLTLQVDEAVMTDRGEYTCRVWNEASKILNLNVEATMFVRVKDKLAALWPFIGICAEVIVLCAIILVYERNRMKSELEESDTDISPEQKNTPDHGKESVRQRK